MPNDMEDLPPWGTPQVPDDLKRDEIAKQLTLIDSLRTAAEAGTIVAMSVVILRPNFVPEHAFSVVPYSAAVLLSGMDMAMDDLKERARAVVMKARSSPPTEAPQPDAPQDASAD